MVTEVSTIFAALADPTRLDILLRVAPQQLTVGEIAREYDVSQPAITKQLNVLEGAGLIARERHGRNQIICPVPSAWGQVTAFMGRYERLLDGRLNSLDEYLNNKPLPQAKPEKANPTPERTMGLTHYVGHPRSDVWAAYLNPEDVVHWWAPSGSVFIDCQIDAREGGMWRFTIKTPSGRTKVVSGMFKEVEHERKLVYSDGFDDPRSPRTESLVTVTFTDAPQGGTLISKEITLHPRMYQLQEDYITAVSK